MIGVRDVMPKLHLQDKQQYLVSNIKYYIKDYN